MGYDQTAQVGTTQTPLGVPSALDRQKEVINRILKTINNLESRLGVILLEAPPSLEEVLESPKDPRMPKLSGLIEESNIALGKVVDRLVDIRDRLEI